MRISGTTHKTARCATLLLIWSTGCAEPETSVRPGINDEYKTTDVSTWVERFETESREVFRERRKIIAAAEVKAGMCVADIGAGSGIFTTLFSRAVGENGKVIAVDILPSFLDRIRKIAAQEGLSNVSTLLCTERDSMLSPGSIDLAFICDTYHHFEYPKSSLASIRKALKPGGVLVVVDFERIPEKSRPWILTHVRAGKGEVRKEIEDAGFHFLDQPPTPFLEENYILRFRR